MDILYNNNLVDEIVDKLFKHKRTDYSEFNLCIFGLKQSICSIRATLSIKYIALPTKIMRNCMPLSSRNHPNLNSASSSCMDMAQIDSSVPTSLKKCQKIMHYVPSIFQEAARAREIW